MKKDVKRQKNEDDFHYAIRQIGGYKVHLKSLDRGKSENYVYHPIQSTFPFVYEKFMQESTNDDDNYVTCLPNDANANFAFKVTNEGNFLLLFLFNKF